MARSFSGTDRVDFGNNAPLSSASDWTAFAWMYKTSNADGTVVNKRKGFASGSNLFTFGTGNGASNNPNIGKNGNFCNFDSVNIGLNAWHAVSVQGRSSGCRCWYDGASSTASGSNNLGTTSDWRTGSVTDSVLAIGRHINEAQDTFVGRLAEVAVWSTYLTDAEQAALAKGVCPKLVSPQSLVFYCPLIGRNSPETDFKGGLTGTVTGTSTETHPRIYYPSNISLSGMAAAAAARRLFAVT